MKNITRNSVMAVAIAIGGLQAYAINVFTATSGDWNTPGNWSEGIVPTDGDSVVIDGNVSLTNSTAELASLSVAAGKTLTFDGWDTVLTATTVSVTGAMTHAQNNDIDGSDGWTPNARVNIVCDDFILDSAGKIDIKGKGYLGGQVKFAAGSGPGGGSGSNVSGGAGYGGVGGRSGATSGLTYGSYLDPADPGSGGGLGQIAGSAGAGGGALRIVAANTIEINGIIDADGVNGDGHYGSGGSGGGVYMSCNVLKGTGERSTHAVEQAGTSLRALAVGASPFSTTRWSRRRPVSPKSSIRPPGVPRRCREI